ncbi:MAG: bifunctional isocitrate dehydrogenase kinase/phosphatase, partial [Candidatus Eremiobacterota bacterium]
ILEDFDKFLDRFREITARARYRFAHQEWRESQLDGAERLDLYKTAIQGLVDRLRQELGERSSDKSLWAELKQHFRQGLAGSSDPELRETFFNSAVRRFFPDTEVDPQVMFVASEEPELPQAPVGLRVYRSMPDRELFRNILNQARFGLPYRHQEYDCFLAADQLEAQLRLLRGRQPWHVAEMFPEPFYRNKGAYLVGRLRVGEEWLPLVLALVNVDGEVALDAVVLPPDEVSILFSFTRSYFNVETAEPGALVNFLKSIMPHKRKGELYTSIGHNKHGKTLLYRDLLQHLAASDDRFETAPGEKGMVMTVFTLPNFGVVFKLIKDRFSYPKRTTRREVMEKYRHVYLHDRAGRMVDAHEFVHLEFDKQRFDPACLDELLQVAGQTVSVQGDRVVIQHLYTERKVIPLNLYVKEAPAEFVVEAVKDYGACIKDLAWADIFPGDLLLKNFGVTRHGRVVFYDYDEICTILECCFRDLPETDEFGQQMGSVGPQDTFPEELQRYLGLSGLYREAFKAHHADLFRPAFWRAVQERLRSGWIADVRPYREQRRLRPGS